MSESLLSRGRDTAFNLLKSILIGTIVVFAAGAGYMSFLIFERQESLSKVSRFDVAWSASQGVNEFIRLFQRITAFAEAPSQARQQEVLLRFEILKGREQLFESGEFRAFVAETAERQAIIERLASVVTELEGLISRVDDPQVVQQILTLMAPLEADLIGLASEAAHFSSVEITEYEQDLLQLHRNFSIIGLGFFLCGSAFVALLGWHNRLLSRTQGRLKTANRELQDAASDLARMARHDPLTGLPNRLLLREAMEADFASHKIGARRAAIMCLDLDNFKNVNDSLGHSIGDALLREIARRVAALIGETGLVARFGGDEFVVLLQNLPAQAVAGVAADLVETIAKPFHLEGHQVVVGASIGIAIGTDATIDPDSLLRNADLALYRSKADGRGTFRFFDPEMDASLQRRRLIEVELRSADFDRDFELYFQPLINLQTKKVSTIEVLLRWPGAPQGNVSPAEFIPIAEESGLIVPLGAWVLNKACAWAAGLPSDIRIAVNLSTTQFRRSNIVATISEALAKTGLLPDRLELEITETLLLDDNKEVHAALRELRALGIRISLDDFGTGYSSLGYLRKFTVDKVKIDRSFVSGIAQDADHLAIVQAVVGLTHALGMASVAEGVETEEELLLIRASGCNEAQGHLISRPLPADLMKELLYSRHWELKVA